ncbi:glycine--tRNA ligase subunit beta [Thalassobacillus pellis]|uniref:glycine--tRNA ligase subunit beta n=1 Tax=Thalassobacillus pellis TaxID=748008 RepID=UPI001960CB2D|nr:glycine--tRNA ligase subunit beta [Thalassobacillus pellis]MBM7554736.1 glycyl-tRNA synthetase beta chain [Thalassobacillus pellis]
MSKTALFEIGLEELPARFIDDALVQLKEKTSAWLDELRIPYDSIYATATPRRLTVKINGLAEKQPDQEEEAKGPAKKIALDSDGKWTKAAIGFTKGQGKIPEDIYFKEINGTEYVHVNKFIEGLATIELLSEFKEIILSLNFPKNMRWGNSKLRYIRPIRWLVALYGKEVVPFTIEGVETDRKTSGHRFLGKETEIADAENYEAALTEQYVVADLEMRKNMISTQIKQMEDKQGWKIPVDEDLLNEVVNLVEYPTVFHGSFDGDFLEVPEEALITSMKEHQRYFPVRSSSDELLPHFVAVRNGNEEYIANVAKGNEKVLRARLADAQFFYQEDQKLSIEKCLEKLDRMVFQEDLGTLADKVKRTKEIAAGICNHLRVDKGTKQQTERTAELCKFDLVTNMVGEFPELQGIMGEKYARIFGEDETVAKGINEHYMPRQAGGELPVTTPGNIVSIADKLDTIVGCFTIGIIPSGSQDPYGLRRQAIGILQMLEQQDWDVKLEKILTIATDVYAKVKLPNKREEKDITEDLNEFFRLRASYLLRGEGIEADVVEAVLSNGIQNVPMKKATARLLADKRNEVAFKNTQEALGRVLNIARKSEGGAIEPSLFENDTEQKLFDKYNKIREVYVDSLKKCNPDAALAHLTELTEPIHAFFDHTMVMAENEKLKKNRLALMKHIADDIHLLADLNAIQWKQQY